MKIIIGLGNPGKKYENTRHNIGFRVIEKLAKESGVIFKLSKRLAAEIAKSPKIILAKPQTFMNDSGRAVQKLYTKYKIQNTDLLVIHDEIDLPFGKLRLSRNSGSAGHKGIESIIAAIGADFARLRIGVDNRLTSRFPDTETYVLQNFTPEEEQILADKLIRAGVEMIGKFLSSNS